mmetsp:Transcript_29359/g.57216  ORF Transcript_29359/g.57216 Transcript_29359/m.57216 type:complete len:385 (-) Transcript_29359:1347-2501(-)
MANIALFFDGTWNHKDRTDNPTSVARMSVALDDDTSAKSKQTKHKYIPGVGANDDKGAVGKAVDKLRGGALGRGLTKDIRDGYVFLRENYKAGDKIFIFGFSRGAYTARSLAGLIRASGLVRDEDDINKAIARYRNRASETGPKTNESLEFRAEKSPDFYTNETERDWRREKGKPVGDAITIAYMGIFDTVGSNGIPGILSQLGLVPGGHGFHDHELSSMVQSGRHALGLDERRRLYGHTEWANLPRLNRDAGMDAAGGARYRQAWFPGDHGMIGGSGAHRQISNTVLAWVLEGAAVAGLEVTMPADVMAKPQDYTGPLTNKARGGGWAGKWRSGPADTALADVHDAALKRVRDVPEYRPKSLKLLKVSGWQAMVDTELSTRIV